VKGGQDGVEPLVIERRVDPNISHPFRQKDIIEKIGPEIMGIKFSPHTFQAIVWKYEIRNKPHLCWRSNRGEITRYSGEVTAFLKKLTKDEIEAAIREYKDHQHRQRYRQ
jgi:hypothetical protein